jgi:hypothetical protein
MSYLKQQQSLGQHQVGIMTEKIKKLEQLVRIKDSKIEVGRIRRYRRYRILHG